MAAKDSHAIVVRVRTNSPLPVSADNKVLHSLEGLGLTLDSFPTLSETSKARLEEGYSPDELRANGLTPKFYCCFWEKYNLYNVIQLGLWYEVICLEKTFSRLENKAEVLFMHYFNSNIDNG